jgi:hypothetical protein
MGPSATDEQKQRFLELMRDIAAAKELANSTTLSQMTSADLAESDGRFAKRIEVIGSKREVGYATQPKDQWTNQQTMVPNTEPPLGFSVDAMEPLGTYAEIEASIQRNLSSTGVRGDNCADSDPTKPSGGEGAGGEIVNPISVSPPSLRKRPLR